MEDNRDGVLSMVYGWPLPGDTVGTERSLVVNPPILFLVLLYNQG